MTATIPTLPAHALLDAPLIAGQVAEVCPVGDAPDVRFEWGAHTVDGVQHQVTADATTRCGLDVDHGNGTSGEPCPQCAAVAS